ncbi:hypothetical protein [Methylomonas sp. DH-1]|uniref:hypothetical protein n=1 Tax=Methylomonas sp. (strain DH-1) TaxID=1727196 RepID=UPI0007C889E4|nr:hypothetical protein [Methylomonas sp. DH-1]
MPGSGQRQRPSAAAFSRPDERRARGLGQGDTLEIIHGKIALRELSEVLVWAKANRDKLAKLFEELQL